MSACVLRTKAFAGRSRRDAAQQEDQAMIMSVIMNYNYCRHLYEMPIKVVHFFMTINRMARVIAES